jgi:hypothetical protein
MHGLAPAAAEEQNGVQNLCQCRGSCTPLCRRGCPSSRSW